MISLIQDFLSTYDEKYEPEINLKIGRTQFSLFGDLLLIEKLLTERVTYKHFVEIGKRIGKHPDEVRARYLQELRYLSETNIQAICEFLQQNGFKGQIIFKSSKFDRVEKIDIDNDIQKADISKVKFEFVEPPKIKKRRITHETYQFQYYSCSEFVLNQPLVIDKEEIRFDTNEELDQQQRYQQEKIKNHVHDISLWYDIEFDVVWKFLYQVSGSFQSLYEFLENRNNSKVWRSEEDELLLKEELQSLIEKKGKTEVEKRNKIMINNIITPALEHNKVFDIFAKAAKPLKERYSTPSIRQRSVNKSFSHHEPSIIKMSTDKPINAFIPSLSRKTPIRLITKSQKTDNMELLPIMMHRRLDTSLNKYKKISSLQGVLKEQIQQLQNQCVITKYFLTKPLTTTRQTRQRAKQILK